MVTIIGDAEAGSNVNFLMIPATCSNLG